MRCLLLIDIQNDFLPGGSLAVPEGEAIIPIVNRITPLFPLVVATQDWHPSGHKSFASSHPGKHVFDVIDLDGLQQVLWPDHCVQSSQGAALSPELNTNKVEAIFRKGTDDYIDSYSAFFDNGHRKSTSLSAYLRARGVTDIYLAGLAGDFCVYYSAKDGLQEGFNIYLVEDAIRSIDAERFAGIRQELQVAGGQVVTGSALTKL